MNPPHGNHSNHHGERCAGRSDNIADIREFRSCPQIHLYSGRSKCGCVLPLIYHSCIGVRDRHRFKALQTNISEQVLEMDSVSRVRIGKAINRDYP